MKEHYSTVHRFVGFLCLLFLLIYGPSLSAQVSFSQTLLDYNGNQNLSGGVTGMMFGPDNRLYVTSLHGKVNIFTIERNGTNDYQVTDVEVLDDIQDIVNHDDDGTACSGSFFQCNNRETIGIVVAGSAQNPVFYVSSSDVRIGAGSGGGNGDVDLDTNSGVITRFSWTGSAWDVVDIVRGLPRSEENHATNGLDLVTIGGKPYLLVAQGGHTNGGGPSVNFVFSTEYALAAAVLAIDLDAINGMPVQLDNGRKYIYDLPTLDDPTRPNANGITDPDAPGYDGIDVNDPWGGNDGLNQAKVVPNGPVKILSPGYRNAYDLVVTESGALYVTDNGANGGWGGFPVNEGTANVNNDYDPNEPGSQSYSGGEHINNKDHLQLVTTDLSSYVFGQYYGGHPNPVRANPSGAGLYTAPGDGNAGAVFRTQIYDPSSPGSGYTSNPAIALPADWPPVPLELANVVEGDWRGPDEDNPDGPLDGEIAVWGTNTNGIAEYRASNFNGAMQGDLLATASNGNIRRVQLTANGQLESLNQSFLSGTKGYILGIATTDDDEIFPGTIWTGDLSGNIQVFEPLDFVECVLPGSPGYQPTADNDFDGYSNQDEIDNGTDICNGGSQPSDFDSLQGGTLVSDLNDPDDDFDGIPDVEDPFQLGDPSTNGSDAFSLPVANDFFNYQQGLGGYLGLGLTGFMNNGMGDGNWLNFTDRRDDPNDPNPNDVMGGAPGIITMHMTSGTALGIANTQEKGLQYGAQVDASTGVFRVTGGMVGFTGASRLYGNTAATNGELGFFIGDGTQSNYIKFVVNTNGFVVLQEVNDIPGTPISVTIAESDRPESGILFHFVVDPATGTVNFEYQIDGASPVAIGELTAEGPILEAIQNQGTDLALGLIGTSNTEGVELEGSWDFLNISGSSPIVAQEISDLEKIVGSSDEIIDLDTVFDDNQGVENLDYALMNNTNPEIGASIVGNTLTVSFPSTAAQSTITVRATDDESLFVETSFNVTVIEEGIVLYRVNSGGPTIASIDGGIAWGADQPSNNSPYLSEPGSNSSYVGGITNLHPTVDANVAPLGIFNTERFDTTGGVPNMTYSFPVPSNGNYEIRLYMGNGYSGTSQPGDRIFDVLIEGIDLPLLKDIDLSDAYGHATGAVVSRIVKINDGAIDIEFLHGAIENPLVNGIEILDVADGDTPIYVFDIPDQMSGLGEQLNGGLIVDAHGGDGNLTYSAEGLPPGLFIEPTNGQIGGTVEAIAAQGSPYTVTITIDDNDGSSQDATVISFQWSIEGEYLWTDKNENLNYTARHENSFVQAGDKFYLMGGRENSQTIDIYDYTTNTWTSLANSAPMEFNHFQATEYKGLIWVIGSFQTNVFPNEVPAEFIWMFDPASQEWIQGPEIPENRRRGSAGLAVYQDKFYIVGGNTDGHDGGYVPWFDVYDPSNGTWTTLTDAPRARDHFSAVVIGDKLYAAGGRLSGGAGGVWAPTIAEVDVYDFTNGTWSTLPNAQNIPTPRGGAATVNFNDRLLVIGGEVEDEVVYGVLTDDALKITEEYDPVSSSWTRLPDLNHERHGTQAIVSGPGVHILAGSPSRGGGNQKNMEFLGVDSPVGTPSQSSVIQVPESVVFESDQIVPIDLSVIDGNVGVFVRSMEITGVNASDFNIDSGDLTNAFLSPNQTHTITVSLNENSQVKTANLIIEYGNSNTASIALSNNPGSVFSVTNPGDQNNNEGDIVSLQIQATSANNLTFNATGLPPNLTIDENTGLISGTIDEGVVSDGGTAFNEENGLVIVEAESGNTSGWNLTTLDGETGIIANNNSFSGQNGSTILYEINIEQAGVYRFNWRSFYSGGSSTDENDNWLRFPNNDDVWFFGFDESAGNPGNEASIIANLQGSQTDIVFPRGTSRITTATTPEGSSSNGYFKIYRSGGSSEVYDWQARTSDNDPHGIYIWFVNPGTYTMEISERSSGHAIDRFALYKVDEYGFNYNPNNLTDLPESQQSGSIGGPGAADNSPYNVSVTVTDNGNPGGTETVNFLWYVGQVGSSGVPTANAAADITSGDAPLEVQFTGSNSLDDVGISSYQWNFGDGSSVSNEADPVHTYANVGTYNAVLTVTDADGQTDTDTLTINVTGPISEGVVSFTLVDASTDTDLLTLSDGQQLDLGPTGGQSLNVRANTLAGPGSVLLELTGPVTVSRREGVAPYALFGDISGNYNEENLPLGDYTLTATAYNGGTASSGVMGQPLTITFSIVASTGGVPTAVATADVESGEAPLTVNFTGSNSLDDVGISSYQWDFGDGSAFSSEADPTHTYTNAGNYSAVLTVTDGDGQQDTDTVTITVTIPLSAPPSALAQADQLEGDAPLEVQFTGSNSLDDVGISSYQWNFGDGSSVSNEADPVHTYANVGTYNAVLTVTDADGQTDTDTVTINVTGPISEGVVSFTLVDASTDTDLLTLSDGQQLDLGPTGGQSLNVRANTLAGPGSVLLELTGPVTVSRREGVAPYALFGDSSGNYEGQDLPLGDYTLTATAYNGGTVGSGVMGQPLTITFSIVASTGGVPTAVATADVESGEAPLTVNFTGSNSLDDVGISSYQWDFGDGSAFSSEADPTHTYTNAGNYSAVLTVTDGDGQQDTDTVTITVTIPLSAFPSALAQADQLEGDAPLEVQFTGSNSLDDVGISSYQWNFGDSSSVSNEADPVHTYANVGTYNAVLTVTDADGQTDTDTVTINVTGPISEGVVSFTLVDASTDTDLLTLSDGQQLDLGPTGGQSLNVRANTLAGPGSVLLELTGPVTVSRREGVAPYALFGDISGNYNEENLPLGDYTLTATAYNGGTASSGVMGQPLTISFSVVTGLGAKGASLDTVDSQREMETQSNSNGNTVPFDVILFPNPGATNITLTAINEDVELRDLMFFNSSGQLVRRFLPSNFMDGKGRYSFPIHSLQSGVYHLKMMTTEGRIYFKQLIVRK
ncbi:MULTISPECIES: PKD domain-containing protein [unclassified Allomuricauda]|uniref:PKD domain-containing protein n=1 Tax=unclassified Allomuricauda TaxID=2615049 RepID=UPI00273D3926|nr:MULTISPECIES: PKD domain-containing protein [unclassified Allomuricauda]